MDTGSLHQPAGSYRVLGMTTFIVLVVAAAVGLHNGLGFEAGWSLIMAVVGVGLMLLWVRPRAGGDHRVIVQDMNTGETRYQPMDNDTRRYLATRKDKDN